MSYITATVSVVNPIRQDGTQPIVVSFTGDAGEAPVQRDYTLDESSTNAVVRRWVADVFALLNGRKSNVGSATVGQVIPPAAPIVPPVQTAQDVWAEKARRLARARAMGTVTGALATAITALQADIDSTYQAGFLGGL